MASASFVLGLPHDMEIYKKGLGPLMMQRP